MLPFPGIFTPSYNCCATVIILLVEQLNNRAAACCIVLVINGGAGCLFTSFVVISLIFKSELLIFSRCSLTSVSDEILIFLYFLPSRIFSRLDQKLSSGLPFTFIFTVQNSSVTNLRIISSRSQIRRSATDCTRPALNPRYIVFHNMGLTS